MDVILLMKPPVPNEGDFSNCPDGKWAWRNFGGLTLDEAAEKFKSAPAVYREDFGYMGPVAFVYYFPVIDQYLRETIGLSEMEREEGRNSWDLSYCIQYQFRDSKSELAPIANSAFDLCDFMMQNIEYFIDDCETPSKLEKRWRKVQRQINKIKL